jgi:hypothetical protein
MVTACICKQSVSNLKNSPDTLIYLQSPQFVPELEIHDEVDTR